MKTIQCQHCEETFQAETKEEMLNILYSHYMETHADVIPNASEEDKKAWMVRFEKEWMYKESA
jgi:hypothetical protein